MSISERDPGDVAGGDAGREQFRQTADTTPPPPPAKTSEDVR